MDGFFGTMCCVIPIGSAVNVVAHERRLRAKKRGVDFWSYTPGAVVVFDELGCGCAVMGLPKTGFCSKRIPARRKKRVARRRRMREADMAGLLKLFQCAGRAASQPVDCVTKVV
jgi:hypothetical protein